MGPSLRHILEPENFCNFIETIEDVNLEVAEGHTALTLACRVDSVGSAIKLIERGADPNRKNEDGTTALTWCRSAEMAKALLESGARISREPPTDDGMLSLHWAAYFGNPTLLTVLLSSPDAANYIDYCDNYGMTPLGCAAEEGNYEATMLLIKASACVDKLCNLDDGDSETPLTKAVRMRRYDVVQLLLNAGAEPSAKSERGLSASELSATMEDPRLSQMLGGFD